MNEPGNCPPAEAEGATEEGREDAWYLEMGGRRRIELPPGEVVIGRGAECDLVLSDATVSRRHALLAVTPERVTLRDLGSSNGSFVNGQRLRGESPVEAGDRLRLGRVRGTLVHGVHEAHASAGRAFCPHCGARVGAASSACPRCGHDLSSERPMSRSEAVAMSEVMPVGEALASPAESRQRTRPPFPLEWEGVPSSADEDTAVSAALAAAGEAALDEAGRPVDRSEAAEGSAPLFLPAAGIWSRAAAGLLEAAWLAAVYLAAARLAAWWGVGGGESGAAHATVAAGAGAAALAWALAALVGWSRWGTTPGKRLLRLYVCDLDGRPGIGPSQALRRLLGSLVTVLTLGLGFLWVGLAADRRALHDHLAGTYVGRR